MSTRPATHAGTWYSEDRSVLASQISNLLSEAPASKKGARVLLGPHAGYTYCGKRLAETYNVWDCKDTETVFILGPSHHVYFKDTALLAAHAQYATPLGHVPVDLEKCEALAQEPAFDFMSESVDADEHSFEMHLPFLVQRCQDEGVAVPKIVPVMISSFSLKARRQVVAALSPYFADRRNTFVVSSDFCHWGRRFSYTAYVPDMELSSLAPYKTTSDHTLPIYKSIEYLDRKAMLVASAGSSAKWDAYIEATGNTICGQKPVAIILSLIEQFRSSDGELVSEDVFQWLGYSQSSRATSPSDSSVSYASGYVLLK